MVTHCERKEKSLIVETGGTHIYLGVKWLKRNYTEHGFDKQ
jgi:hypothetical protein